MSRVKEFLQLQPYLNPALIDLKDQVVKDILKEMLEENNKIVREIGLDYIKREIDYYVSVDIKEHQKTALRYR